MDINEPPKTKPGLWCKWIINEDGDLCWNGEEQFYYYFE